jgi:transposase
MELSAEQRAELERVRDRHPKAYMREKAAALLKVADGMSPHAVAKRGLLKARDPDSVYRWMGRYLAEGVDGLRVKPGRGRKAAFFP